MFVTLVVVFIFSFISLLLLSCIVSEIVNSRFENAWMFLIVLVITSSLSWGLIGNCFPVKSSSDVVCASVIKTKTAVVVEYKDERELFTDAATYNELDEGEIEVNLVKDYNMYGGVCGKRIQLIRE